MCMSVFSKRAASMPRLSARALTSVSAACADSFMTSPSWPVRISLPLPGVRVASMNRMSPPTGVHASPVDTPGTLVRIATSFSKRRGPRIAGDVVDVDADRVGRALGDPHRGVAQQVADLALEVAHAGLARVVLDHARAARHR